MEPKLNRIAIIDGSYMLHRCLHLPELWELKSKNSGLRTGGIFGFLRCLGKEMKSLNYYPVVTWDSGLSKRRTEVYPKYKNNHLRTADKLFRSCDNETDLSIKLEEKFQDESVLQEAIASIQEMMKAQRIEDSHSLDEDDYRAQYHRQRDVLITILNSIGVPSIKVSGWEGDDLMVLLQRISKESVILTDDKDLIQMIAPNTDILRPMKGERLIYDSYMQSNGYDSPREIAMVKAIEGDGSDAIPGVTDGLDRKYCVGHTRAKLIAKKIYESGENAEVYIPELVDTGKNYFLGFVQRHDDYIRNMKLVDLSLVENDENVINTILAEVSAKAGKCNLINACQLLAEQEISNFDVNNFIAQMTVLSCNIRL